MRSRPCGAKSLGSHEPHSKVRSERSPQPSTREESEGRCAADMGQLARPEAAVAWRVRVWVRVRV